jgi:prolipoprotein diacylglyceryltransferase
MGQWLCVPMMLLGAGLWWWFGRSPAHQPRGPGAQASPAASAKA